MDATATEPQAAFTEEAIEFPSGEHTLSGVLNIPALPEGQARPKLGVVFANAGSRGRLGNTFQYARYARSFAAEGVASLRFDPHGVGDSEGRLDAMETPNYLRTVQHGRFVADLRAAIAVFDARFRPDKLLVFGICGGSFNALIAAGEDPAVDGAILLALPTLLEPIKETEADVVPAGYAWDYLVTAYSKKILDPQSWMRLIRGESELDTIGAYARSILKGQRDRALKPLKRLGARLGLGEAPAPEVQHPAPPHERLNPKLLPSLDSLAARRAPLIVLFGEQDALRWSWDDNFKEPYWGDDPAYAELFEVHLIEGCNHLFTLYRWQDQALALIKPWLKQRFSI